MASICRYRSPEQLEKLLDGTNYYYKDILLTLNDSLDALQLKHVIDKISCNPKAILKDFHGIDYNFNISDSPSFYSINGCEMLNIDGKITNVEGVLIFVSMNYLSETKLLLNYTYNFLQTQEKISKDQLKTVSPYSLNIEITSGITSCNDIIEYETQCKESQTLSKLSYLNGYLVVFWSSVTVLVLVYFLRSLYENVWPLIKCK